VDDETDHQTERVDDDMALAAIDLLACVEAPETPLSVVLTDWLLWCRPSCKEFLILLACDRVRSSFSGLNVRRSQKPRAGMEISGSGPNLSIVLGGT